MMLKRREKLEEMLVDARVKAARIKGRRPKVYVRGAIAIMSDDPLDLRAINETIAQIEGGDSRDEAIVIFSGKLAKARKFSQAREMVNGITTDGMFWRADACLAIWNHSGNPRDLAEAKRYAASTRSEIHRNDLLEHIKDLEEEGPRPSQPRKHSVAQQDYFADMLDALDKIVEHEEAHDADGAFERARMFADWANILAEELRK
ncbi:MAG: hypothetical protein NT026_02360 [Candidatus Staskawiczbacteria bacterium]|nr:hypothetical protein [Candidatus Staskawiczbacteria bacterium]